MTGSGIFDYDPEPKLSATCLPVEKRLVRNKYKMTKTSNLVHIISNTCIICKTLRTDRNICMHACKHLESASRIQKSEVDIQNIKV